MRILSACLVTLLAWCGAAVEPASAAVWRLQVPLCHPDGTGGYTLVYASGKTLAKHQQHGDVGPGDPVPGVEGYVFDGSCAPVGAAQQACEELGATFAVGAEPSVMWSCAPVTLIEAIPLNEICGAAGGRTEWQEWDRKLTCFVGYA